MNVLVIPEDFRKDECVQPPVEALLASAGRPRAKVRVCRDPLLGGVSQALKRERLEEIVDRYRMVDLFLLLVDRDCEPNRRHALDQLEARLQEKLSGGRKLIAENAWQELEVWILAGHDVPWSWKDVRAECHPKEAYFEPFAASKGLTQSPAGGRKALAREAARRLQRIVERCPEDVGSLKTRLQALRVGAGAAQS